MDQGPRSRRNSQGGSRFRRNFGIKNDKGETFKLGFAGSLGGYQPNPAATDCVLWICRRK